MDREAHMNKASQMKTQPSAPVEEQKLSAEDQEVIDRILKTIRDTLKDYELRDNEIAEAVELYYDAQELRIMHANKKRTEPPSRLTNWFNRWLMSGEKTVLSKLTKWVERPEAPAEAQWAYSQIGIGPVIAAGLAAHIDVAKANHVSSVWKFAGYAPGADRKVKGQKLPYNARLKTLCWKLGESFVKVSGKEGATYGKLYAQCKRDEVSRNENGLYGRQAAEELATKKIKDKETKAKLSTGKLTDGRLHARAKRRAVKIFLQHYWVIGREARGLPVTEPYAMAILGHSDKIEATLNEKPEGEPR